MLDPSVRLRKAIIEGKQLIVSRLLARFPDLLENINPEDGWSNLHLSTYYNYLELTHLILNLVEEKSARIHSHLAEPGEILSLEDVICGFEGYTVLHVAAVQNSEACLELLLQYFHLVLNAKDKKGRTALHLASMKGYTGCVQLLINNGADTNLQDQEGNTPLHLAASFGHLDAIKLLLFGDCDDEMLNSQKWKALDLCSTFELQKQMLSFKASLVTAHPPSAPVSASSKSSPREPTSHLRPYSNSLPPLPAITTARRCSVSSQISASRSSSFSSESNKPSTPFTEHAPSNYTYQSPLQSETPQLADLIDQNSKSPLVPAVKPFAPSSARTRTMSSASSMSSTSSPPHSNTKRKVLIPAQSSENSQLVLGRSNSSTSSSPTKSSVQQNTSPNSKRSSMSTRTFRSNSSTSQNSAGNGTGNGIANGQTSLSSSLAEPRSKSGSFSSTLSSFTSTFKSLDKKPSQSGSSKMSAISFRPQASRKNSVGNDNRLERTRSISSATLISPLRSTRTAAPSSATSSSHRQPLLLKSANNSNISLDSQSSGAESLPDRSQDSSSTLKSFKAQNANRLKLSLKLNTLYQTNTNTSGAESDGIIASPTRLEPSHTSKILNISIKSNKRNS
ncbi:unnamed protein product [Kuraishia capsulata CBS 1993]|uniref:Uncharacterized protein n=1 Tax=Kuraishia capsulata CBS 1993 TaxID=1382522 RepID=W6MLN5_9ASCO|nr:uncharacterized protein KUCA_T00003407001 [Kuraishia capsulata CBS 1993]CDK27429.1 unnamed protein product [Kuraishia capsulata CBS 1993]